VNAFLLASMVAGSEALKLGSAEGVRREKLFEAFARTEIPPARAIATSRLWTPQADPN